MEKGGEGGGDVSEWRMEGGGGGARRRGRRGGVIDTQGMGEERGG